MGALTGGVLHSFVVGAQSAEGEGTRSLAHTASTAPPQPTALRAGSQSTTSVTLSWAAPLVTTGVPVTGYEVYRDDGAAAACVDFLEV
eukprot:COSAG01_NODE_47372_length_391_cov_0.534247_1_plen_87_part_10